MSLHLGKVPVRVTHKHGSWNLAIVALSEYEPFGPDDAHRRDLILSAFENTPEDASHVTLTARDVQFLMGCLTQMDGGGEPAVVMVRSLRVSSETAMQDARRHGVRTWAEWQDAA